MAGEVPNFRAAFFMQRDAGAENWALGEVGRTIEINITAAALTAPYAGRGMRRTS
ncbi:MAG: hypothetical protein IJ722_02080 [Alloprevotella sp.]|nr:hypothetical protein [Alloprevotella sp.]